jgi:hypothetical protein
MVLGDIYQLQLCNFVSVQFFGHVVRLFASRQ